MFQNSRSRLLFVVCLVVAGYFVYSAAIGAVHTHQLSQEEGDAGRQVQLLKEKKAYLEAVKNYVASDAYVEQQARRQLGYIRDREVPFVVVSPPLKEDSRPSSGDWWQRLFPK
jgi:cell division protein FtsB